MISSPADSPANQSALQETDSPKTTRVGSGPSSSESFAWYDPDTSSWKTSQVSLLPEWATYSETWPRAGMTRNGTAFRRAQSVPHIHGPACSLWPTPRANSAMAARITSSADPDRYPNLETVILKRLGDGAIDRYVNPDFCQWLMGFPEGWTDLEA